MLTNLWRKCWSKMVMDARNSRKLHGCYVFVCSHASRDRRSGVCGPAIIVRFKEKIEVCGLQARVSVTACSHIGGHKYAGNIIIFGSSVSGGITGHWYGYVTPDDVPILLEQHIGRGEIVDWLWRGQMGLSVEDQIKWQEQHLQLNGHGDVVDSNEVTRRKTDAQASVAPGSVSEPEATGGRFQENGNSAPCSQKPVSTETNKLKEGKLSLLEDKKRNKKLISRRNSGKKSLAHRVCGKPTWLESWELEDTYAAAAVVCAVASVVVAYKCYRQLG